MTVDEVRWPSPALGQEMGLRVYGDAGRPLIAFPSQDGRYWDFEGFGMVGACAGLIEAGRIRIVAVDGVDWQSWTNQGAHPVDRARRHEAYDRYVIEELVPFVRERTGRETAWATGASMGAYHAANVLFRHPDAIDGLIAMSGLYGVRDWVGDHVDDAVYFNSPLAYLPGLDDPWYLERLRRARIAIVVGQGAWEEPMIADTRALEGILAAKGIPAIVDYWGHDVDHDWPWWRKMLPHYLEVLGV
jgi:esterase/lipase superfamily enzyme